MTEPVAIVLRCPTCGGMEIKAALLKRIVPSPTRPDEVVSALARCQRGHVWLVDIQPSGVEA